MTIILGLESSCDETAAALVTADGQILAHRLATQEDAHRPYGGVVPEIAARAHVEALAPLVEAALADAKMTLADVDVIAATAGPGLIGGVMVGLVTGKALAHASGKPLVAVNHLEGHALSPRLADQNLQFPYLLLLVSGGHCQLLRVEGVGQYRRLATTIDDAAGEAFDKTAKLLGLGYPGGPQLAKLAEQGVAGRFRLPRPMLHSGDLDFSFSGLKTAVLNVVSGPGWNPADMADLAAEFQHAVVDVLCAKALAALKKVGLKTLVVAGGVGANRHLRAVLDEAVARRGGRVHYPEPALCTDNGAMIAFAGALRFAAGESAPEISAVRIRPRWPLVDLQPPRRAAV